jgi:Arc/MetJ-type ribon-helix-helix transcriptional regulator
MGKKKTSISLDKDLLEWVNKKIMERRFASVTHAVEYALEMLRKEEPSVKEVYLQEQTRAER